MGGDRFGNYFYLSVDIHLESHVKEPCHDFDSNSTSRLADRSTQGREANIWYANQWQKTSNRGFISCPRKEGSRGIVEVRVATLIYSRGLDSPRPRDLPIESGKKLLRMR